MGVGKQTDIAMVAADRPAKFLDKPALKELRSMYRKRMKRFRLTSSERSDVAKHL